MELKKCGQCGSFYMTNDSLCSNCRTKDKQNMYKVQNIIEEQGINTDLNSLVKNTGISFESISRYTNTPETDMTEENILKVDIENFGNIL